MPIMGEVETDTNYNSPSTTKRPSPSSVAEMLGIVHLQQEPNAPLPRQHRKGFNNPLPAIGKSGNEPIHVDSDTLSPPPKGLSKSFPSPRSLGDHDDGYENGNGRSRSDGMLPTPRGGKRSVQQQQPRKDSNQLPPLSPGDHMQPNLDRSKTTLTRTNSDGASRPRSNSNPRPKSARGNQARSFHVEASHQRIMAEKAAENTSPRSRQPMGQQVLLTQRRSQETRTQIVRPSNPSPCTSDGEDRFERPSAPSPPSPGLDISDSESGGEFDHNS